MSNPFDPFNYKDLSIREINNTIREDNKVRKEIVESVQAKCKHSAVAVTEYQRLEAIGSYLPNFMFAVYVVLLKRVILKN